MSVTEDGKEGKIKMFASCGFLENELRQFSREEGVTMADSVETLGVDFENQSQNVGSERKREKEKVQSVILAHHEKQGFPKELQEGGSQEVATCGHDASKDLESPCGGDGSHGEVEIEETDGSSSRQEEHDFVVPIHGSIWP